MMSAADPLPANVRYCSVFEIFSHMSMYFYQPHSDHIKPKVNFEFIQCAISMASRVAQKN